MPPKTEVRYPKLNIVVCASPEKSGVTTDEATKLRTWLDKAGMGSLIGYAPPLTAADMAVLLGIETEQKGGDKYGDDFLFKDYLGNKCRATNNVRNRPLFMPQVLSICEEMLNGRYDLNGEPFIVADDATVLNGQHQGAALYLAQQRVEHEKRLEDGKRVWEGKWPNDIVSIDKIVVYGIKNLDHVVNTIDTCRSRTFQNVLYRSPYFTKIPAKSADGYDRKAASSLCTAAVRVMWGRTAMGVSHLSNSTKKTNTARSEWVENHGGGRGKFLGCVKTILETNRKTESGRKLTDLGIEPGYAAAMMYLMMASGTPTPKVDKYLSAPTREAKGLLFTEDTVDLATDFWTLIGRRDDDGEPTGKLSALTRALDKLGKQEDKLYDEKSEYKNIRGNLNPERDHVVCAAWNLFGEGKKVTDELLKIKYTKPDPKTGKRSFAEPPSVGGIDLGSSKIVTNPKDGKGPMPDVEASVESAKSEVALEVAARGGEVANGHNGVEDSDVFALGADTNGVETDVPNGVHPSVASAVTGDTGTPPPAMQVAVTNLHTRHPDIDLFLCRTKLKQYAVWGEPDCAVFERATGRKGKLTPERILRTPVTAKEFAAVTDVLTNDENNLVVGVAVEDPQMGWMVQTTVRPKAASKKGAKAAK